MWFPTLWNKLNLFFFLEGIYIVDLYSISFMLKLNSIWNCAAYLAHNELVCWIYVRLANWLSKYRNPVAQSLTLHGVVHKVQHVNKKKRLKYAVWPFRRDRQWHQQGDRQWDRDGDRHGDRQWDRQDKAFGKRNNVHSQRARSGPDIIIMQLPHTHTHRHTYTQTERQCGMQQCFVLWHLAS